MGFHSIAFVINFNDAIDAINSNYRAIKAIIVIIGFDSYHWSMNY